MIRYSRQLEICEAVRNNIKSFISAMDWKTQMRSDIRDTDTILRAVSIFRIDDEQEFKDLVLEYILKDLQISDMQKDQLRQNKSSQ